MLCTREASLPRWCPQLPLSHLNQVSFQHGLDLVVLVLVLLVMALKGSSSWAFFVFVFVFTLCVCVSLHVVPTVPRNLVVTSASVHTLSYSWDHPSPTNGIITSYTVSRCRGANYEFSFVKSALPEQAPPPPPPSPLPISELGDLKIGTDSKEREHRHEIAGQLDWLALKRTG